MHKDPIVEEVRKTREAHAATFGFNVRAIMEDARKRQAASGHRIVKLGSRAATRIRTQAKVTVAKKG